MRLTRRIQKEEMDMFNPTRPANDKFVETDYTCKRSAYDRDILNKLGQLEDIEDELGIDLITLFKALKNGFYAKGKEKKNRFCYISARFGLIELKNGGLRYSTISMKEFYYFKDYGKTWALDKKDLTNE